MLCWETKKFISDPVNLHELHRIIRQTWYSEVFQNVQAKGSNTLFPVLPELTENVLDVVFINKVIAFHDFIRDLPLRMDGNDFLLVMNGDP